MKWVKRTRRCIKYFALLPIKIGYEYRWLEVVYIYQTRNYYDLWNDRRFITKEEYLGYRGNKNAY